MSLLNEMLQDLAKREPVKQVPQLLHPATAPSKNARIIIVFLCIFALSLFVCTIVMLNKPVVENTVEREKPAISEPIIVPVTAKIPSINMEVQQVVITSYIEPLSSPSSYRVALEQPVETKLPLEWEQVQAELQSEALTASVNKVYTPLTLEEWHDAQLNKALTAIDNGLDERAVEILETVLVKMPAASDIRENLASLYLSSGDYANTTRIVDEGLKYARSDAALLTIKARLLLDQGRAGQAIKLLLGYRPELRAFPDFYGTLAAALQSEGRIREAGSLYKTLIQVDPDNGQYWLGYGIALEHDHKPNQAIEAYGKAIANPDSDPSVRNYAETRLKTLQG